jgi:lysophospholipase L1-like esterase
MTAPSSTRPKLHKIKLFLLRFLVVTVICILTAEIGLRVYNHFDPLPIFYDYSYNQFRGRPFAQTPGFKLNSKGFKDVEYETEKKPGTFRILGIGDSFTYGVVPYPYNYLTLTEAKLNEQGKSVEIINMGIPGSGPREYLALLANEGVPLQPDMVLLSFFLGNDFRDSTQTPRKLYTYSYVASLIYHLYSARTKYEGLTKYTQVYEDDKPNFTDEVWMQIEKLRSEIVRKDDPVFASQVEPTISYLLEIKKLCDAKKISLVVVMIPDELQISPSLQARLLQELSLKPEALDYSRPNRLLTDRLQQHGIDSIDLYEQFKTAEAGKSLYRPRDTHWNIEGNRLAAEIITPQVLSRLPKQ